MAVGAGRFVRGMNWRAELKLGGRWMMKDIAGQQVFVRACVLDSTPL